MGQAKFNIGRLLASYRISLFCIERLSFFKRGYRDLKTPAARPLTLMKCFFLD